jgi:TonB family protein
MQQDDGAEMTRELLREMREEMKERKRAFQVCEGQLLAASANDDLHVVLRGMLTRLAAIEKHLAVARVGRALRAPGNVAEAPAANRRQTALETARIDLAAKARREPPTVKLGEKKARRVQDLLDIGGERSGGLEPAAIERVVRLRRRDLQYCHEAQQRRHPGLAGKVVISATVSANGRVARAEVSHNDTGSKGLGECMTSKIKRWRFPEPGQESTAVDIPFIIPRST